MLHREGGAVNDGSGVRVGGVGGCGCARGVVKAPLLSPSPSSPLLHG